MYCSAASCICKRTFLPKPLLPYEYNKKIELQEVHDAIRLIQSHLLRAQRLKKQ